MKYILVYIVAVITISQGCTGKGPRRNDVLGTWVSNDGASFVFKEDGTFTGNSLPATYYTFHTSKEKVDGKKVNGSGIWEVENDQNVKEVKLHFTKMDDVDINGFYSINMAGSNGISGNKPPWYLFEWKDEEGGERYKFVKK